MGDLIIAIPRHKKLGEGFSQQEKAKSFIHPGRQTNPQRGYQSAASWISDLTQLKKIIILCSFCRVKFNPRKHGYRRYYVADASGVTDGYQVSGKCFDCKGFTMHLGGGTAYVHESEYAKVCMDPMEARRNARAAAGRSSVWSFINKWR